MTMVNGITFVPLFCYNVCVDVFHALIKVTVLSRCSRFSIIVIIICIRTWRMCRRL